MTRDVCFLAGWGVQAIVRGSSRRHDSSRPCRSVLLQINPSSYSSTFVVDDRRRKVDEVHGICILRAPRASSRRGLLDVLEVHVSLAVTQHQLSSVYL